MRDCQGCAASGPEALPPLEAYHTASVGSRDGTMAPYRGDNSELCLGLRGAHEIGPVARDQRIEMVDRCIDPSRIDHQLLRSSARGPAHEEPVVLPLDCLDLGPAQSPLAPEQMARNAF